MSYKAPASEIKSSGTFSETFQIYENVFHTIHKYASIQQKLNVLDGWLRNHIRYFYPKNELKHVNSNQYLTVLKVMDGLKMAS